MRSLRLIKRHCNDKESCLTEKKKLQKTTEKKKKDELLYIDEIFHSLPLGERQL